MRSIRYPIARVDPALTSMELKCVVVKPILRYLECEVGTEEMERIVADSEMSIEYLEESENWVSFKYYSELLERVIRDVGDDEAPFKACQRFSDRDSYQGLRTFLRHVGSPRDSYRLLFRTNRLWNRISEWKVLDLTRTTCRVEVIFKGVEQTRGNCLAIQGSLSALPRDYGLPNAEVTEEACACKGDATCRYRVVWKDKARHFVAIVGLGTGILAGLAVGALTAQGLVGSLLVGGVVGFCIGLTVDGRREVDEVCDEGENQIQALWKSITEREALAERLQDQVVERTAELRKANEDLNKALVDLKESRERELQAEQQATLGVVAGGMAHELNSPLNAVRLSLQELSEDLPDESPLRVPLSRADRASYRCKRIINDLLVCAREPRRDAVLDLKIIVREAVRLYQSEHPDGITIAVKTDEGLSGVSFDQIQMQHVVMNLLKNASDAMQAKGVVRVDLCREGDDVVMRVSDNGPGVSNEDKDRIFQPLYSTKGGRGLGLGLSITKQLVWRNGGDVSVSNGENGGAVFTVRLPVSGQRTSGRKQEQGA